MDEPKPKLLKSKSSNSANTTRSDSRSNKKSRSSAEFQPVNPVNLKKRGMYVEKKPTKFELNTQTTQLPQRQVKPPPRPRPGKKRFLASVFTILSKSIASTQFPEINDDNIKEEKKITHKRRHEDNTEHTQDKKKYKYRSRVLKEHKNDWQKVVVLKPKKDIVQTPSESCNDQESTRWLNLPRLVKQESDDTVESKTKYQDVQVDVATNVTDGRKQKEKRVVIVDNDPTTMVSEETKEKGMYNFFVDLLQTTLSVYNVKPEYDIPSSDVSATKMDFMIDEKVAKKLNVTKENKENTPELTDKSQIPVEQQYFIKEETNNWYDRLTPRIQTKPIPKLEHLKSTGYSRRLKSKSFAGNGIPHSQLPLPRAALTTRPNKKYKKKELLNILKDELRMDYNDFEEPQNLFQALQVIARNKRKNKKSIRFDKSAYKTDNDSGDPECIFKRRNLMSITRKSTKRNRDLQLLNSPRSMSQKHSDINKSYNYRNKNMQPEHTTDLTDSSHTLEVYGFEIDNPFARQSVSDPKDAILPYRSSTTVGELNFESNETMLNFTDSEASYNLPLEVLD